MHKRDVLLVRRRHSESGAIQDLNTQRSDITFSLNENTLTQFIDSNDILSVPCPKQLLSFPPLVGVTFIF